MLRLQRRQKPASSKSAKSTASAANSDGHGELPSGPCHMPSSPPEKFAIGRLVQFGLESNVANPLCGQWGTVIKAVDDRVWFMNQQGNNKEVAATHVEVLESPPTEMTACSCASYEVITLL